MTTLIGKLVCLIALPEDGGCDHCFEFITEAGDVISNVHTHPDCPLEVLLEATFEDKIITDWSVLEPEGEAVGPVSIALIAVSKTDEGVEKMRQRLERDAGKIEAAGRRQTNTPFVMELHAIKVTNTPHISSSMFWQEVQQKVGTYDKYWVWGGSRSGFCGHAYVSSSRAITYSNCAWYSFGHEGPGHSGIKKRKGLGHSGAGTSAYGERDSFMGNGNIRRGWSMPMLEYLEQIPEQTLHIVGEGDSKQIHLIDPLTDEVSVYKNLWKGIVIDKAYSQKYRVAYSTHDKTVRVYRPEPKNRHSWSATWMLAKLSVGQSYDNDIHVEYVDWKDGVAKVNVKWNTELDAPNNEEWPVKNLEIEHPIDLAQVGLWHNDNQSYQGLDIHISKNTGRVVAYWYVYDNLGNPQWYMLEGPVSNNIADLTVYKADSSSIEHVGTAQLYFLGNNTGIFKYFVDNRYIGRDGFVIKRLSYKAESDLYGVWDIEGRNHEGLSITVNNQPDGQVTVQGFWYKNTGGDWWLISGNFGEELDVYRPHDGFYKVAVSRNIMIKDGTCWIEQGKLVYKGEEFKLNQLV